MENPVQFVSDRITAGAVSKDEAEIAAGRREDKRNSFSHETVPHLIGLSSESFDAYISSASLEPGE
jgi:hypothetical protein